MNKFFLSSDQNCFEAQLKTFGQQILSRFGNWKLATKCFWAFIIFFQSVDQWCKLNHHQSNNWKFWVTNKFFFQVTIKKFHLPNLATVNWQSKFLSLKKMIDVWPNRKNWCVRMDIDMMIDTKWAHHIILTTSMLINHMTQTRCQ
jgi:hypothetical protein